MMYIGRDRVLVYVSGPLKDFNNSQPKQYLDKPVNYL